MNYLRAFVVKINARFTIDNAHPSGRRSIEV